MNKHFRRERGPTSELLVEEGGGPLRDRAVQQALLRRQRSTGQDRHRYVNNLLKCKVLPLVGQYAE